ncbi:putative hydroxymethylpyrimidine transport system ATP-binding protein [Bisgaardia hudsonensis]|uniref:Putative hydroxymethylpyrimidine transport system ATP-binding protein n=1 Tax=Bisgaardia hudsonensis TaxID=109472 RepID=A0A4R2N1U3_9PAST|nr:ABC transporter ATP-binding protein [Bisgaardia hudsonensis]QLB12920.1 phosphonate ABC transporter ATP-binding protein [Bisgaardia hudsonensis]TCP13520.1 putative hydroxymethylpyrimidine transport system ATP-binding protein [Bisgaardia hudsonensis]
MSAVSINNLAITFDKQVLFKELNLSVPFGYWVALLGRSGVGKSTLLRAIAGLEKNGIQQGNINTQGKIAWLAQQDSLYPWLSILDNVQLKEYLTHRKTKETKQRAESLLNAVGMTAHLDKACYQLSGGQRQRVALARTLMQDADIILMDEPFSALDAVTKLQLQNLSRQLLADKTVLLITHDPQEAIRLADQIYILQTHLDTKDISFSQPAILSEPIHLQGNAPRDLHQATLWQLQQQLFNQLIGKDENAL